MAKQANDYDADGDYVRHWLPELKNVPARHIHAPWNLSAAQQEEYKVKIGVDYPRPPKLEQPWYLKFQDVAQGGGGGRGKGGRKSPPRTGGRGGKGGRGAVGGRSNRGGKTQRVLQDYY